MKYLIPISGKDSLTTAYVQMKRQPDLPYEFMYNDTMADVPEVAEWLNKVEKKLNIKIQRIGLDLEELIYDTGMLPSFQSRFCTRLAKIKPMEKFLGEEDTTIYLGLRADEDERIGYRKEGKTNIFPVYPLRELGLKLADVYKIVDEELDLMPPAFFWQWMWYRVREMLGSNAHIMDKMSRVEKQIWFSWRTRPNCYFCFNQALYEWIGLSEHHPELFDKAVEIEKEVGAISADIGLTTSRRDKEFLWKNGYPLKEKIWAERDRIKEKRARQIVRQIMAAYNIKKGEIYIPDETDNTLELDALSLVSCGLFCGK